MRSGFFKLTVVFAAALTASSAAWAGSMWLDIGEKALADGSSERAIVPEHYRTLRLDSGELQVLLATTPSEKIAPKGLEEIVFPLPLPDNNELRLRIVEAPVMAPELAKRYPEITTYRVFDANDNSIQGRIDWTPQGFHAMVRTPNGTVFIDPYTPRDTNHYISYYKHDLKPRADRPFTCHVEGDPIGHAVEAWPESDHGKAASGTELRTYRLAMAATGEYTDFHGGTVPAGLAAIVTAVNRVNQIYEQDAAIHMELIATTDQVIYTDGATDPYTNNNGSAMLTENQNTMASVIGSANYDIGHVFSTGGGGIASLASPCKNSKKAKGVTGLNNPIGDPFYIDFVAHEMGHQWSANHTFNGNAGGCIGNRTDYAAYEPGSGSTIMAYAGLCSPQNLQQESDAYFHSYSLDQITTYSQTGFGNNCAVTTATGNTPPTVDAGNAYTIPHLTPFELTGSASDVDGDSLTYCWEEFDLGPAGHPNTPVGNAPTFRSFDPTEDPMRSFPKVSSLVNNSTPIGERLPTINRTMNFRLTVRDNHVATGGINDDTTTVESVTSAGPFLVTSPNTLVTWDGPGPHTVTWDVAGTDSAPISCSQVNILLSTDVGYNWTETLASAVDNDGEHQVMVSAPDTTLARLRVECSNNIFFDISNSRFVIQNADIDFIFIDGFESGDTSAWSDAVQ